MVRFSRGCCGNPEEKHLLIIGWGGGQDGFKKGPQVGWWETVTDIHIIENRLPSDATSVLNRGVSNLQNVPRVVSGLSAVFKYARSLEIDNH